MFFICRIILYNELAVNVPICEINFKMIHYFYIKFLKKIKIKINIDERIFLGF